MQSSASSPDIVLTPTLSQPEGSGRDEHRELTCPFLAGVERGVCRGCGKGPILQWFNLGFSLCNAG